MSEQEIIPAEDDTAENAGDLADELAPGTKLLHGQYTITSFLNAGGFGITYRAVDSLERPVVIKECFPGAFCRRSRSIVQARSRAHKTEFGSIVRLFVQEARSLSKLVHPNIVGVHQVFEENDTAYMALDFVEGRDLLELLEDDGAYLTPTQIESILRAVLDAIGFVHAQNMLHRDISPDNILLKSDMTPVLIDFGAARQQAKKESRVLSAMRVVKDGYSPQEFYVTGSEQGPYSDLYALGASFYHLIMGVAPPDSQTRLSAIAMGSGDPYETLVGRVDGYPQDMLKAIDHALKVLPKERLQSAAEWLAMMDGVAPTPAKAAPAKSSKPAKKTPVQTAQGSTERSSRVPLMAGVAAIAIAAAGFGAVQMGMFAGSGDIKIAAAPQEPQETSGASTAQPTAPKVAAPEIDATPTQADVTPADAPATDVATAAQTPEVEPELDADASSSETVLARGDRPTPRPDQPAQAVEVSAPVDQAADAQAERPALVDPALPRAVRTPTPDADPVATVMAAVAAPRTGPETPALPALPEHGNWIAGPEVPATIDLSLPGLPTGPDTPVSLAALSVTDLPGADTTRVPPSAPETDLSALPLVRLDRDGVVAWSLGAPDLEAPEFGAEIAPAPAAADPSQAPRIVLSETTVGLPFDDLRASADGSMWIRAVDGESVDSLSAFRARFDSAATAERETVSVELGLGPEGGPVVTTQVVELPVLRRIRLLNGMQFNVLRDGDGWITRVTDVPSGVPTDLRPGDVLYAYVPTGEQISGPETLSTLFDREVAAGRGQHDFAVDRDGSRWLATLSYDPTAP